MTKAQLRAYKHLRQERDKLKGQIQELESLVYGPKGQSLDGMPRSGAGNNSHVIDRKGDKLNELRQLYGTKVAELEAQMLEIERAIEPLEPRERTILRLHYFQGFTWEQVAVATGYTWRHVHRIHGAAIEKLQGTEAEV